MSMNYYQYVQGIADDGDFLQTGVNLPLIIPTLIEYAEQRMYRELDLLATRVTDATASFSSATRNFALPTTTGSFLVVESINVFTPLGYSSTSGYRNPVVGGVAREFIDATYGSNNITGLPAFFAMVDNANVIVGPSPDAAYHVEVIGTQRPTPLSSANQTTILTTMLPDVFYAASMIYLGQKSSNAAMSERWEKEYQTRMQSASVEELRKKYQSQAWTNQIPNTGVVPPRA